MNSKTKVDEVKEETLEDYMSHLVEVTKELKRKYKAYKNDTKELRATKESLENIIKNEVLKRGKTVAAEGIKAEYVPTVVIRLKKDKNNEQ